MAWFARLATCCLMAVLAGCGTLPASVDKPASFAPASPEKGTLQAFVAASQPSPEMSGFRLLPMGIYALDARLQLIRRAQHTLDLQYYVIENDDSGQLLLRSLRDAAQRGVRVRLLVDDLYTSQTQDLLRALTVLPGFEVRLFNPFCCAREGGTAMRYVASLGDFSRLNHRMHNKLFVADGVAAIAGGRNIADEYFTRNPGQNFIDMDCLIVGAVVPQLEHIFDRYWNNDATVPVAELVQRGASRADLQASYDRLMGTTPVQPLQDLPEVDVLGYGPLAEDLDNGRIGLIWGSAFALADQPEKVMRHEAREAYETSTTMSVRDLMLTAESEVVVTSPYLIPGTMGMEVLQALRRKNVKVLVLTNSLASNDEPLVHTGYARYRPEMLRLGVDLYELSPARAVRTKRFGLDMFGTSSTGRLHAKTVAIDRRTVFIGSMNLDPRSASKNTEMGVIIDSPQLARELIRVVSISRLQSAYRLRLTSQNALEWLTYDDDREMVLTEEPESSGWTQIQNLLFGFFVPEEQL
jgi:cardiolipin synthase C